MPGITEASAGPNVTIPQSTSRRRPPPTGDEEATARLKLGDCANEQALSTAEVALMLEQLELQGDSSHDPSNDIYYKTKEYCKHFARFKEHNSITLVNGISTELTTRGLGIVEFERAQLGEWS